MPRTFLLVLLIACPSLAERLPLWRLPETPEALTKEVDAHLAAAKAAKERLFAVEGARTVENTLVPYDEVVRRLMLAAAPPNLLGDTHPDAAFRKVAQAETRKCRAFLTQFQLDPQAYRALAALEGAQLSEQEGFYVRKALKQLRQMGAQLRDDKRAEIASVRAETVKLEQQFSENIVAGRAFLKVPAADLDGLPSDFLRSHPADSSGAIAISNDRGDIETVANYASKPAVRRMAMTHGQNRGYPANMAVLDRLIALRHKLAVLTGYSSFAALQLDQRMVGSETGLRRFLDDFDRASRGGAAREESFLLKAKQKDEPAAATLDPWDNGYYARLVRRERYDFDEREARPFFPYAQVQRGVLEIASRLFGIRFERVTDAPVWHPSVTCWDVFEGKTQLGRIYLDMHPRDGKYQHFRSGSVRGGVKDFALPEGVLVCNFDEPKAGGPALLSPRMAETFFHEFGHLLHSQFAGGRQWAGLSFPEPDFMEAPSQMLEEWMSDPNVLASFARHHESGEPIPSKLVERMVRAAEFGKARSARAQLVQNAVAYAYHSGPGPVDTDAIWKETARKYNVNTTIEGAHRQSSWTHMGLAGYAATYYVYSWSQAIAKDLRSGFDPVDLMARGPAQRFRDRVLAPGGSKPAAELIGDFLGRPFSLTAFEKWLNAE